MEICMKSLSGHGRKSLTALFIIAVQFYGGGGGGGRALLWDVPGWIAQPRTVKVTDPLLSTRGFAGSSEKIRPPDSDMVAVNI